MRQEHVAAGHRAARVSAAPPRERHHQHAESTHAEERGPPRDEARATPPELGVVVVVIPAHHNFDGVRLRGEPAIKRLLRRLGAASVHLKVPPVHQDVAFGQLRKLRLVAVRV